MQHHDQQEINHTKLVVSTQTVYLADQSDPQNQKFTWSYEITINNATDFIVQLLGRCWRITDMTSRVEEVQGAGVVGLQPIIKPGKQFTYISFCQLTTPQGTMEGYYEMQNLDEKHFIVEIPKFILSAPSVITATYRTRLH